MEFSLLSVTTTLLIGAGCFAIGYLLAGAGFDHHDRRGGDATATTRSCSRLISWAKSVVKAEAKSVRFLSREEDEGEDDDEDDEEGEEARQQRRRQRRDRAKQQQKPPSISSFLEIETLAEILEDFKMVLVVRNDLKMGKGKIAAQSMQLWVYTRNFFIGHQKH